MKHNYIFLLISILFISMLIGVKQVYATGNETLTDYSVNLLNDDNSDEVCTSLLGENLKNDLESVMGIIRIVGPLIVIFLTTIEFITALTGKDDDAIKKCTSRLFSRLILIAVLFLLPTLLNLFLNLLDQKYTTCIR